MSRYFRFTGALTLMLCASLASGQVPFEVFGNGGADGLLPEEEDGWDGDAIRITHDGNANASNGVSFNSAVTGDYSLLEIDFEIQISNEDDAGDADGIGFAYANVEIFGEEADEDEQFWGGGEEPNLTGSIGVGFDTWMNVDTLDDPEGRYPDATLPNSFSLHYDGQLLLTLAMEDLDLDDDWIQRPTPKRAHIEVVGGDGTLSMDVTDVESGETVTVFDGEELPFFEPYDGRVVFKARTGGENSNQDVDNISVTRTLPDGTREDPVVHYGQYVGPGGGGGVLGDYNNSGERDPGDIDDMTAAIAANSTDSKYDLNGDGSVTQADRDFFIEDLSNTFVGDSNWDGQFSSSDFVTVFVPAKYETGEAAGWAEGDWNGDGVFGSSDFVKAFTGAGYEIGLKEGGLMVVPEPSSLALILLGTLGLTAARRRK